MREPVPELIVTDPDLTRALTVTMAPLVLGGFIAEPAAVADVSRRIDRPLGRVHYWVRRLESLGALRQVDQQRRAGRPIRLYRATARSFRVPSAAVPDSLPGRMATGMNQSMTAALAGAAPQLIHDGDLVIAFDRAGVSSFNRILTERPPADRMSSGDPWVDGHLPPGVISTWRNLHLTDDEARDLSQELWRLVGRYSHALGRRPTEGPTTRRHLVRIEMAPAAPNQADSSPRRRSGA